jgi:GTP-binding GTPase N-terminal
VKAATKAEAIFTRAPAAYVIDKTTDDDIYEKPGQEKPGHELLRVSTGRAIVIVPVLQRSYADDGARDSRGAPVVTHSPADRLTEATGLAEAIDLEIADARVVGITTPRPSTLFGKGKVEELRLLVE